MNPSELYEIKARAFELVSGLIAPGKDTPPGMEPNLSVRTEVWDNWILRHSHVVEATIRAMQEQP